MLATRVAVTKVNLVTNGSDTSATSIRGTERRSNSITFRLRGKLGSERVEIKVGSSKQTLTLSTSFQPFTFAWPESDRYSIELINGNGKRDVDWEAVTPSKQTPKLLDRLWRRWRCGRSREGRFCNAVRRGTFAWQGTYLIQIEEDPPTPEPTPAPSNNVTFRLKGKTGSETVEVSVGPSQRNFTLSTSFQIFSFAWPDSDRYSIKFLNDQGRNKDIYWEPVTPSIQTPYLPETAWRRWAWKCGSSEERTPQCNDLRAGNFKWGELYLIDITAHP